jgi:hypothetical protein
LVEWWLQQDEELAQELYQNCEWEDELNVQLQCCFQTGADTVDKHYQQSPNQ